MTEDENATGMPQWTGRPAVLTDNLHNADRHANALLELTTDAVFHFEFDPGVPASLGTDEQIEHLKSGILVACNVTTARLHNARHPDEIIGKSVAELLPVSIRDNYDLLRSFIENRYRTIDTESKVIHSDGSTLYFIRNAKGFVENGKLVRLWGMWRDITARRAAERRLHRSETRLKEAQRLTKVGNGEMEIAEMKFEWSDEIYRILEVDPTEVSPSLDVFSNLVHPEDRQMLKSAFDAALQHGRPYSIEHRLVMPDGSMKFANTRAEFYFDATGRARRAFGTIQDITERRQSQDLIEQLMIRLEALTSVAFDGIALSEDGLLSECSPQFVSLLGYGMDDVTGRPIIDFVAPAYRAIAEQSMAGDAVRPVELRMLQRDGSTRPVELVRGTISAAGRQMHVYGIRDISVRKALQEEVIAVTEDERRRIGRDLHDSVGQLLFGASLSLTTIQSDFSESRPDMLDAIDRVREIIADAMDETRRVSHLLVPKVDRRHELSAALTQLAAQFNEMSSAVIEIECDPGGPALAANAAEQLYRITQEAISNALKHGSASRVRVRLASREQLLLLEIEDNGSGMPLEPTAGHSGLGIRSMRYRANLIDASLDFLDAEGGGTRIVCTCPVVS